MRQFLVVHCPCCTVGQGIQYWPDPPEPSAHRTDFYPYYEDGDSPLRFEVRLCWSCGFAGRVEGFVRGLTLDPFLSARISDVVAHCSVRPVTLSEVYERAAQCAEALDLSRPEVADLWLRAAWACVIEEDTEAEEYYMRQAISSFIWALDGDDYPSEDRPLFSYLIGELLRRTRRPGAAAPWFNIAATTTEQKWLLDIATLQQTDPVDVFVPGL